MIERENGAKRERESGGRKNMSVVHYGSAKKKFQKRIHTLEVNSVLKFGY